MLFNRIKLINFDIFYEGLSLREDSVRSNMTSVFSSDGFKVWQCTVCSYSHKKSSAVIDHIEAIHCEKIFCSFCEKSFNRTSRLKQHMKMCQAQSSNDF